MLLSLPTEDIVRILELCDYLDIISCSMVCRRLRDIATEVDWLAYIVALAAAGLQMTEDWTDATLATSEKLARVREYDETGSRGGQLSLFRRLSDDTALISDGYRFEVQPLEDGMMSVAMHKLGGPRCSSSPQVLPIIPLPVSSWHPTCMVDPARRVMIIIYETGGQWVCSVQEFPPLGLSPPIATFHVGRIDIFANGWKVFGDTLLYGEQDASFDHHYCVKDIRSGLSMLTLKDPHPDSTCCLDLVAEDMLIRKISIDPVDLQVHPNPEGCSSPELRIEVLLLSGPAAPTVFSLGLPEFNDQWQGVCINFGRPPAVDGKYGRFDGLATSDDNRLYHMHFDFRCPTAMNTFRWPVECSRDDILLLVHVNGLRALLRALRTDAHDNSYALPWEEWAAHARLIVLRPPPIPERMAWRSGAYTSGMRVAFWLECWLPPETLHSLLEEDHSPPSMRQLAIIDAHPRRVARHGPDTQEPFALSDDLHGTGWVRPFKDENVYAGGLSCVEYTYVLPPEVSRRRQWGFDVATTLDGVVVRTQKVPGGGSYRYAHCTIPRHDV